MILKIHFIIMFLAKKYFEREREENEREKERYFERVREKRKDISKVIATVKMKTKMKDKGKLKLSSYNNMLFPSIHQPLQIFKKETMYTYMNKKSYYIKKNLLRSKSIFHFVLLTSFVKLRSNFLFTP